MKDSVYLYGVEPSAFADMKYSNAIEYKLQLSKELYHELMGKENTFYANGGKYDDAVQLRKRVKDVGRAVAFNEGLLDELRGVQTL